MENNIAELKKQYSALAQKHSLPRFEKLNEDFEIEKIVLETEIPLKVIRRIIIEKIGNYMNFFEMILNPVNAPRIYMQFIKSMTTADRDLINKMYESFGEIYLLSLSLEVTYSEKNEAEAIKKILRVWDSSKPNLSKVMEKITNPSKEVVKNEKNYFG